MNKLFFICVCIFLFSVCHSGSMDSAFAADTPFTVLTENVGEENYIGADGLVKGFNAEIVAEIIRRTGLSAQIRCIPWARSYRTIQTEKNVVLFSMARTPEREPLFK